MNKWYDEEYEFTVEVTGFYMEITLRDTVVTAKKSETNFLDRLE